MAEQVLGSGCERGAKEELLSFSFLACPLPPSTPSVGQGFQCLKVRTEMGRPFCRVEDNGALEQGCCSECGNKRLKSVNVLKEKAEFSGGKDGQR